MKIISHWIDHNNNVLQLELQSETQEESNQLIYYANHFKLPVKSYGKVDKTRTWAWVSIPLKQENYKLAYFGNDKV